MEFKIEYILKYNSKICKSIKYVLTWIKYNCLEFIRLITK